MVAPGGAVVGEVSVVTQADDGSGDALITINLTEADSSKVAAGVWSGVSCTVQPSGGSIISLVDKLGDDATGLPKFMRMQKSMTHDDGRQEAAERIKSLHAGYGQRLTLSNLQKGGSIFECDRPTGGHLNRLAKVIAAKALQSSTDTLDAIRAVHLHGPRRSIF